MKTIKKSLILITIISLPLACSSDKNQPEKTDKPVNTEASMIAEEEAMADKTVDDEESSISVRGYIDVPPENRVAISPFYGGYVKNIRILPGTEVAKGDVLFTLQNPLYVDLQQEYLEAQKQIAFLKEDFERQQVLSEEEIASRKSYTRAEADYQVMLAKAIGLKEKLKMLGLYVDEVEKGVIRNTIAIHSPISGYVSEVNISRGTYIDPGTVAAKVINTDHMHLELEVFEKNASKIMKGQPITFTIPEMSPNEYRGEVHLVVPAIDMQKRTVLVHGHMEESTTKFLPGMYVDARIEIVQ